MPDCVNVLTPLDLTEPLYLLSGRKGKEWGGTEDVELNRSAVGGLGRAVIESMCPTERSRDDMGIGAADPG
jgi:hypothetical protein